MDFRHILRAELGDHTPDLDSIVVIADLSEGGALLPQAGLLRAVMQAKQEGKEAVFVAKTQQEEAAIVSGVLIHPAQTLEEIIAHLKGSKHIDPLYRDTRALLQAAQEKPSLNYADIIEDENAKHALEIAVIGHHHLVLYGDPRSGKRRLAEYLPSMLPRLSPAQALEISLRHSDLGRLSAGQGLMAFPAVQVVSPITSLEMLQEQLFLSHLGVLILQDLAEIPLPLLELITEVQRTRKLTWQSQQYSCQPLIVGLATKPSAPALLSSFIDIYIEVPLIDPLDHLRFGELETSIEIRERIEEARALQLKRYKEVQSVAYNADLRADEVGQYVPLDQPAKLLLTVSMKKLGVSPTYTPQVLRVARSITDRLGEGAPMHPWHVAEAVQYLNIQTEA